MLGEREGLTVRDYVADGKGDFGILNTGADADGAFVYVL